MNLRVLREACPSTLLFATTYYGVAATSLALTQGTNGIATIWPASGVLLTALLITAQARWPLLLGAVATASLAANLRSGNPLALSLGFTLANLIEGTLAALVLSRWCAAVPSFLVPREVGRFAAAGALAALASAGIASIVAGASDATLFWSWFTTDLAGILTVTPVAVTLWQSSPAERTPLAIRRLLLDLAGLGAVTLLTFAQSRYPLFVVPLTALVAVTYRRGTLGAAAGVLCIALIGSVATALDRGPMSLIRSGPYEQALFFQFYLLILFALALPGAAMFNSRRQLLRDLRERERLYRLLADNSNDMIALIGLDGNWDYVSPASRLVVGYEPHELIGRNPIRFVHPEDRDLVTETCLKVIDGEDSPTCTYRQQRKDGGYVWLEATYRLAQDDAAGARPCFVASTRDVTARVEGEIALKAAGAAAGEANRLLSIAERIAQVGHWRLDLAAGRIFWSAEIFRIHGVAGDRPPDLSDAIAFYHQDDRARIEASIAAAIENRTGFEFEARLVRTDGDVRNVFSKGEPELDADGHLTALFGTIQDVTQRTQAELALAAALEQARDAAREATALVQVDQLTGAASRRHTMACLEEQIRRASAQGSTLAVAMFDIDHFKAVNDRYGHEAGDQVLMRVAGQAMEAVAGLGFVGRLGGEEFVIVLESAHALTAVTVAERFRCAVAQSVSGVVAVTVSLGVAQLRPGSDARSLLRDADQALYQAKAAGRNALKLAA